jgi:hypothetical protein
MAGLRPWHWSTVPGFFVQAIRFHPWSYIFLSLGPISLISAFWWASYGQPWQPSLISDSHGAGVLVWKSANGDLSVVLEEPVIPAGGQLVGIVNMTLAFRHERYVSVDGSRVPLLIHWDGSMICDMLDPAKGAVVRLEHADIPPQIQKDAADLIVSSGRLPGFRSVASTRTLSKTSPNVPGIRLVAKSYSRMVLACGMLPFAVLGLVLARGVDEEVSQGSVCAMRVPDRKCNAMH